MLRFRTVPSAETCVFKSKPLSPILQLTCMRTEFWLFTEVCPTLFRRVRTRKTSLVSFCHSVCVALAVLWFTRTWRAFFLPLCLSLFNCQCLPAIVRYFCHLPACGLCHKVNQKATNAIPRIFSVFLKPWQYSVSFETVTAKAKLN